MIRIEEWHVSLELFGVTKMAGKVYGHEKHENGKLIKTAPVISFDKQNKTFKTYSGNEYVLGAPENEKTIDIITAKEFDSIDYLEIRVKHFLDDQKNIFRLKAEEKIVDTKSGKYSIYRDDVLTKGRVGYTIHTGICMVDLPISDDEVENWDRIVCLSLR